MRRLSISWSTLVGWTRNYSFWNAVKYPILSFGVYMGLVWLWDHLGLNALWREPIQPRFSRRGRVTQSFLVYNQEVRATPRPWGHSGDCFTLFEALADRETAFLKFCIWSLASSLQFTLLTVSITRLQVLPNSDCFVNLLSGLFPAFCGISSF